MTAPSLLPATTEILTALLEARTGQQLSAYRSWRLDVALKPLLRLHDLSSIDALARLLMECDDVHLHDQVADALVNAETSFFRDAPLFDAACELVGRVTREGRRPRIWSAGCSTGQEPLSLAMICAEQAEAGHPAPEIVATDVSDTALARARTGRYTQFEVQRGLPIRRLLQWFGQEGDDWVAVPQLLRQIRHTRLNLAVDPPPPGRFDLVLCRNVLLYFAPEMKERVFATLAAALRPGGLLALGAGETVIGQTRLFRPSREVRGLYERVAAENARAA